MLYLVGTTPMAGGLNHRNLLTFKYLDYGYLVYAFRLAGIIFRHLVNQPQRTILYVVRGLSFVASPAGTGLMFAQNGTYFIVRLETHMSRMTGNLEPVLN